MENTRKGFELTPTYCWHNIDEEPIHTDGNWDNEFVVRLKNGNKRIVYSSFGRLKDCINGEYIPTDVIMLWVQLPKEN
jgi:hypothetical protein